MTSLQDPKTIELFYKKLKSTEPIMLDLASTFAGLCYVIKDEGARFSMYKQMVEFTSDCLLKAYKDWEKEIGDTPIMDFIKDFAKKYKNKKRE